VAGYSFGKGLTLQYVGRVCTVSFLKVTFLSFEW